MELPFQILYEDNHLLVVNKPAGMLVQGDRTGIDSVVEICKNFIKIKYNKPGNVFLGLTHRLDRPVSGVVVLTKTSKALERVNQLFRQKEIEKIYWALTTVSPPEIKGTLTHWLVKDHRKNIVRAYNTKTKDAVRAELEYSLIGKIANEYLLEIKLITGRPHQIRVQLKSIGCPIIGDVKYGFDKANNDGSICLHAKKLILLHPVKKEPMIFEAPLPERNWNNFHSFFAN